MTYKHLGIFGANAEGCGAMLPHHLRESGQRLGCKHHLEVIMHTNDLSALMELRDPGRPGVGQKPDVISDSETWCLSLPTRNRTQVDRKEYRPLPLDRPGL